MQLETTAITTPETGNETLVCPASAAIFTVY